MTELHSTHAELFSTAIDAHLLQVYKLVTDYSEHSVQ